MIYFVTICLIALIVIAAYLHIKNTQLMDDVCKIEEMYNHSEEKYLEACLTVGHLRDVIRDERNDFRIIKRACIAQHSFDKTWKEDDLVILGPHRMVFQALRFIPVGLPIYNNPENWKRREDIENELLTESLPSAPVKQSNVYPEVTGIFEHAFNKAWKKGTLVCYQNSIYEALKDVMRDGRLVKRLDTDDWKRRKDIEEKANMVPDTDEGPEVTPVIEISTQVQSLEGIGDKINHLVNGPSHLPDGK